MIIPSRPFAERTLLLTHLILRELSPIVPMSRMILTSRTKCRLCNLLKITVHEKSVQLDE